MMDNFLNFIEEDIDAKKTLISTMPKKTDSNIRKYNDKIIEYMDKYNEYEMAVRNYLIAKSNSFKITSDKKNIDTLNDSVTLFEYIKFLLNPSNTYFEKVGFDNLLYRLINYYEFNVDSLVDIINEFLSKFELIGVKLDSDDFNYTCYVHEYMISFFEARNSEEKNYEKVSNMFEKIYWVNPEIVQHIELNLRKLIKKNEKKFIIYIEKLQKEVMANNGIISYSDCLEKLKNAYENLEIANKEDIFDITVLAKDNVIDMTQFFEDSKFRMASYDYLIKDSNIVKDEVQMIKIYDRLEKLKSNVKEYENYLQFLPLFKHFKEEFEKYLVDESKSNIEKELKETLKKIDGKEKKLEKINKKIFSNKSGIFAINNDANIKQLKVSSVLIAKEIYELYMIYEEQYFNSKVISILNKYLSLSDILNLYYSYDYFKKLAIKKVYDVQSYEELNKYSENFDLFAMNPLNIIINGILLFEENNISQIIINKYKIDDIYLDEDMLGSGNLDNLKNKIDFLLRINVIENSKLSVEQIWFMAEIEKIISVQNDN